MHSFARVFALWRVLVIILLVSALSCLALLASSFEGTWEGEDADPNDDSITTLVIEVDGDRLTGTLSDTFSAMEDGRVVSPGYTGEGSGRISSETEAQMTFELTRSDGDRVKLVTSLTLIGSTLELRYARWNDYRVSPPALWAYLERVGEAFETASEPEPEVAAIGEDLASETFALGFFDSFDDYLQSDWDWFREDRTRWTLSEGFLDVQLQQSGWVPGEMINLLTQPAPEGDFTAEIHLIFEPTANFQEAGLILFSGSDTYYKIGREYADWADCRECKGSAIAFAHRIDGELMPGMAHHSAEEVEDIYLRITVEANIISAYYSFDGATWQTLNFDRLTWEPVSIGLYTNSDNEPAESTVASFGYFAMQEGVTDIAWVQVSAEDLARIRALSRSFGGGTSGSSGGLSAFEFCDRWVFEARDPGNGDVVSTLDSGCLCGEEAFFEWWNGEFSDWRSLHSPPYEIELVFREPYCGGCVKLTFVFTADGQPDGPVIDTLTSSCICDFDEQDAFLNGCFAWLNGLLQSYPGGDAFLGSEEYCTP